MKMPSIMHGTLRHRRFLPVGHCFDYGMSLMLFDLDCLQDQVVALKKKGWPFSFFRFDTGSYLDQVVCSLDQFKAQVHKKAKGFCPDLPDEVAIHFLCQVRSFGLYFSPLNVYYFYDQGVLFGILAEVSNTPWHEKHHYWVPADQQHNGFVRYKHKKEFHVSPFNKMPQSYHWRLPVHTPGLLHLEVWESEKRFDASLSLKPVSFEEASKKKLLFYQPSPSLVTLWRIYSHALLLWVKGAIFHHHP